MHAELASSVRIGTGRLSDLPLIQQLADHVPWDVTVKSGDRSVAPEWRLVLGYKNGALSVEDYTAWYLALLAAREPYYAEHWQEVLRRACGQTLVLCCYCPLPPVFCHRHVLRNWLVAWAQAHGIRAEAAGEVL